MSLKKQLLWLIGFLTAFWSVVRTIHGTPWHAWWSIAILYALVPLLSRIVTKQSLTILWIVSFVATILLLLIGNFSQLTYISGGVFVIGIAFVIYQHYQNTQKLFIVSARTIAGLHKKSFAFILAIVCTLSIRTGLVKNPPTCEATKAAYLQHQGTIAPILFFGQASGNQLSQRIDDFFNKSPNDLIQAQMGSYLQDTVGISPNANSQLPDLSNISPDLINSVLSQMKGAEGIDASMIQEMLLSSGTNNTTTQVTQPIMLGGNVTVDGTETLCDIFAQQITPYTKQARFSWSIGLVLLLIILPLIQLLLWIISPVLILLYMILEKSGFLTTIEKPTTRKEITIE